MRFLLAILGILFFGILARAEEPKLKASPWHVELLPLNGELRYERNASLQTVSRQPLNLALGVRKGTSTLLFEYSKFTEETGNATLSIERSHQEYSFWWKEDFMSFESLDFFISGGLGGYEEKVKTTLAGSGEATDTSGLQAMGGASVGVQTLILRSLLFSLEGRLIAGGNFDPNPQVDLLARLGVEF